MSQPFFITGLPRSRTAWWSVAMTQGVSFCRHEPLKTAQSFDALKLAWLAPGYSYAGVADSGLVPQIGRILAEIEPQTLIIERDPLKVLKSFVAFMGPVDFDLSAAKRYINDSHAELLKWKHHPLVKWVNFEDLEDLATVEECIRWLTPAQPFLMNPSLLSMNVQVTLKQTLQDVNVPHSNWFRKS